MRNEFKDLKKALSEMEMHLERINNEIDEENDASKNALLCVEQKKMCDDIKDFICNVYAKKVFDFYNPKKPKLVRCLTKEVFTWDEAFGSDFSKIPSSLRESLVGLVEGSGKYKLK